MELFTIKIYLLCIFVVLTIHCDEQVGNTCQNLEKEVEHLREELDAVREEIREIKKGQFSIFKNHMNINIIWLPFLQIFIFYQATDLQCYNKHNTFNLLVLVFYFKLATCFLFFCFFEKVNWLCLFDLTDPIIWIEILKFQRCLSFKLRHIFKRYKKAIHSRRRGRCRGHRC